MNKTLLDRWLLIKGLKRQRVYKSVFSTEVKTCNRNRETNGPSIRSKEKNNFWIDHLFRDFICRKTKKSKTENCTACSFTRIFHLFICYITEINLQCLLKFERLALILHPL